MRIEKRKVADSKELAGLVREVLEGEMRGFHVIDQVGFPGQDAEAGLLAGSDGHVVIVAAKEGLGDSLVLSYGRHVAWVNTMKERLARENPQYDWEKRPGIVLMAEAFSSHALLVAAMLAVTRRACYLMKCLGIGSEKGLYVERVDLPEMETAPPAPTPAAAPQISLLSRTVNELVSVADGVEFSASFGYRSESLDWVPVANLRSHRGTVWVESGPGKWSAKRIEDETSLDAVLDRVRRNYEEAVRSKGRAKDQVEADLSEDERRSLR